MFKAPLRIYYLCCLNFMIVQKPAAISFKKKKEKQVMTMIIEAKSTSTKLKAKVPYPDPIGVGTTAGKETKTHGVSFAVTLLCVVVSRPIPRSLIFIICTAHISKPYKCEWGGLGEGGGWRHCVGGEIRSREDRAAQNHVSRKDCSFAQRRVFLY